MSEIEQRVAALEKELAEVQREKELLEARLDELRRLTNLRVSQPPVVIREHERAPQPWPNITSTITRRANPLDPLKTPICQEMITDHICSGRGCQYCVDQGRQKPLVDSMNDQPLLDAGLGG